MISSQQYLTQPINNYNYGMPQPMIPQNYGGQQPMPMGNLQDFIKPIANMIQPRNNAVSIEIIEPQVKAQSPYNYSNGSRSARCR